MLMMLRHTLSIVLLPVTVTIVIPLWIARQPTIPFLVGPTTGGLALTAGAALGVIGLVLFASTLYRFAAQGHGTLAPWDPPRRLVICGAYRYVRNPMIAGVVCVLFAQALLLNSRRHLTWAIAFVAINVVYIPLVEEPQLRARFGEGYDEYCRHVPRLIPRLRPWSGGQWRDRH
jgi:protein-S-isoprenylcysteine O-methyltransferase Ste14